MPMFALQFRRVARCIAFNCLTLAGALSLAAAAATANESIAILPRDVQLTGPSARQQLVIERIAEGRAVGEFTNAVAFESTDERIFRIENGAAVPVGNGEAKLLATVKNQTIEARVSVADMDRPFEWSFRNNVQPVLAKFGCSAGACHGAAAGQNGFRLSLRGYDNEGDHLSLTRHAFGRRIVPGDPGRSLVLLKATATVPHKGGAKFDTSSLEYRVLAEWIAAGAPGPKADEARIDRIEVLPPAVILKPGMTQQLLVRAHFNDGHSEDVTRWVKYTDANASVTQVDENGFVKVLGHGEGAITAWYLSRIAVATVSVPYDNDLSSDTFAKADRRNFIDDLVLEKLASLNLPPSPRAGDAEFIRRVHLDTLGVLPTADEARAFLADTSPAKRDVLIEAVLNRSEFVDYWSYKWSDLLLVNSEKLRPAAMWSYYNWIRHNVSANTPWDEFARKLVTARGSTVENGAANFFVLHEDPATMAETTSQAFLGMSINCAKCHNHPMEKWTNDEYYGMANLFARVRAKNGTGDGDRIIFAAASGDLNQPLRGRPQAPRPLDGKAIALESPEDRRVHLTEWLTSPENPYFSRAIVNRVWANFFAVGLVESVDDLRVTNPASNEKLLSAAASHLVARKFDLKALMRVILQSETYQRSSQPLPGNAADTRFYSHYYPRRIMAEALLDAISQATGAPTQFPNYPDGWRALQLPDSNVASYFLKSFGRPDRIKTCECERTEEPSMAQVLHLANGDTINKKLAARGNRIEKWVESKTTPARMIEEIYLSALSRFPTESEATRLAGVFNAAATEEKRAVVEDIFWAVLSSKEFLFSH